MAGLWDLSTLDSVFAILFLAAALTFLLFVAGWATVGTKLTRQHPRWRVIRRKRGTALRAVVAFAAILGVWLAYGSIRNQLRMGAENASNDVGTMFVDWERDRPFIRCLYTWYSNIIDHDTCIKRILGSPDNFSETLLYIEEVFIALSQSRRAEEDYRSPYFSDIVYWREFIAEDPTGFFSFHLVSRYGATQAREGATKAGVCIPNLCAGYERVRVALHKSGFNVDDPNVCRIPRNRQFLTMHCPRE